MQKTLLALILLSASYLLPSLAQAQQYGVGAPPQPTLVVNKKVMHPKTGIFVENLTTNDPKYAPDQVVTFQITVKNTSSASVAKTIVTDLLPKHVNFGTGSGTFDAKTRTLTVEVQNLKPSESKTFSFTTQVVPMDKLPSDQGIICVVNQATATSDVATAKTDGQTAQDTAQFCVQKPVLGAPTKGGLRVFPPPSVTVTPPTGPEALSLLLLIPSSIAGILLRRKSLDVKNSEKERG